MILLSILPVPSPNCVDQAYSTQPFPAGSWLGKLPASLPALPLAAQLGSRGKIQRKMMGVGPNNIG